MALEQNIQDILNIATEKGLENLEIRIGNVPEEDPTQIFVVLWVNGKDRFSCNSLVELEKSLTEQDNLDWAK